MCRLLLSHLQEIFEYRVRSEHVKSLVAYVRRCSRIKWNEPDLHDVCEFLQKVEQEDLLQKFVRKGSKQFPQVAYYHLLAGELEIRRGPFRCNRAKARSSLEVALRLSKNSKDSRDKNVLERAQVQLTFLEELQHRRVDHFWNDDDNDRYENGDFGPGATDTSSPAGIFETFAAMCDQLGIDPEELIADVAAKEGLPNPFAGGPNRKSKKKGFFRK
jgi:hypothetical protein